MTVINKLEQTLEMIKSSESNCKTFSMDTDDPNAKQLFTQVADTLKQCENMLQSRVNYVVSQEPQYQPQQQQKQVVSQQEQQNATKQINIRDESCGCGCDIKH
ncbi:MAG: DUF1657 domain-containing protein [Bacillota bacterium]|nr:DUF1657 domain-containing protein [Bacillota bacterium]